MNQSSNTETIKGLLHHNRDVEALLPLFDESEKLLSREELQNLSNRIQMAGYILPAYDAVIKLPPLEELFDLDKLIAPTFIYTPEEVQDVLQRVQFVVPERSTAESFLLHRGVTRDQMQRFSLGTTGLLSDRERILTGSMIHPAIQRHVGVEREDGILFPIFDGYGQIIGTHVRYLNTLPGLKFSSTVSECFMYHNFDFTKNETASDVYLLEGVFDCLALDRNNPETKWISPSSGYLSLVQTIRLEWFLKKTKAKLHILLDNDGVGMFNALLINLYFPGSEIDFVPPGPKDVAEAICRDHLTLSDFKPIHPRDLKRQYEEHRKTGKKVYSYTEYEQNRAKNQNYNFI